VSITEQLAELEARVDRLVTDGLRPSATVEWPAQVVCLGAVTSVGDLSGGGLDLTHEFGLDPVRSAGVVAGHRRVERLVGRSGACGLISRSVSICSVNPVPTCPAKRSRQRGRRLLR